MKTHIAMALVVGMMFSSGSRAATAGRIRPGSGALLATESALPIDTTFTVESGSREFVAADQALDVDILRIMGRAGLQVLPWLYLDAGAGWALAESNYEKGEGGLAWLVGTRLALIEQVIASSPVAGVLQSWGLAVEAEYSYTESDSDKTGFSWYEFTIAPLLHYTINRRQDGLAGVHRVPQGALILGLLYSDIDGDRGPAAMHAERNFATIIGGEVLLHDDWAASLRAVVFANSETVVRLTLGRYF